MRGVCAAETMAAIETPPPATRPTALPSAPFGFDREAIERVAPLRRLGAEREFGDEKAIGWTSSSSNS